MNDKETIDKLEFTIRTLNVLKRAGIDTLDELLEVIDNERLHAIRGMGMRCATEIMQKTYCRNCERSVYGEYASCDINIENNGLYCRGVSPCGCKVRMEDGRKE